MQPTQINASKIGCPRHAVPGRGSSTCPLPSPPPPQHGLMALCLALAAETADPTTLLGVAQASPGKASPCLRVSSHVAGQLSLPSLRWEAALALTVCGAVCGRGAETIPRQTCSTRLLKSSTRLQSPLQRSAGISTHSLSSGATAPGGPSGPGTPLPPLAPSRPGGPGRPISPGGPCGPVSPGRP